MLVKDIRIDSKSYRTADDGMAAFKKMILESSEINVNIVADKHDSAVEHVHYITNEYDLVSIFHQRIIQTY